MNELEIPEAALEDKHAFEILRVWAAFEEQHVSINSNLNGGAREFGIMLADLALHGAILYAGRNEDNETEMLKQILDGFNEEIINESGDPSGGIQK